MDIISTFTCIGVIPSNIPLKKNWIFAVTSVCVLIKTSPESGKMLRMRTLVSFLQNKNLNVPIESGEIWIY